MADPFEEIWWKIGRADVHYKALSEALGPYMVSNFYRTSFQTDRRNRHKLVVTEVDPVPKEVSLLIGDTAHNLRSALDHLIWLFARPTTERQEKRVQFPIADHRKDFRSQGYMMPGVSRKVRTLVERLQPYHRRKWPDTAVLGYIREIDNWDKHRALTTTTTYVESPKMEITIRGDTTLISHTTFRGRLEPGAVLTRMELANYREEDVVHVEAEFPAIPIFDNRMPKKLRGVQVVRTLDLARFFIRVGVLPLFRPFAPYV